MSFGQSGMREGAHLSGIGEAFRGNSWPRTGNEIPQRQTDGGELPPAIQVPWKF